MEEDLSRRIKQQRESLGLSFREMSRRTGISASFLSQIESNSSIPTITILKKIANALDTSVGHLIGEEQSEKDIIVTRKNERKSLSNFGYGLTLYFLATMDKRHRMEPTIQVLEKEDTVSGNPPYQHNGDEFCFVLEGSIKIMINNKEYSLKEGDSIYFNANAPHSIINEAVGKSTVLFVTSPPYF